MAQVLLEKRKETPDSPDVIFWTSVKEFYEAILMLGGRVKATYHMHGVPESWDLIISESKENIVIETCRNIKKSMQE